jgi:hypothetical protein
MRHADKLRCLQRLHPHADMRQRRRAGHCRTDRPASWRPGSNEGRLTRGDVLFHTEHSAELPAPLHRLQPDYLWPPPSKPLNTAPSARNGRNRPACADRPAHRSAQPFPLVRRIEVVQRQPAPVRGPGDRGGLQHPSPHVWADQIQDDQAKSCWQRGSRRTRAFSVADMVVVLHPAGSEPLEQNDAHSLSSMMTIYESSRIGISEGSRKRKVAPRPGSDSPRSFRGARPRFADSQSDPVPGALRRAAV